MRQKVEIDYRNEAGSATVRVIRPLALAFFGPVWLCTSWCELRDDFRNFRVDRMSRLVPLDIRFADEPGKRMVDYACRMYGLNDRPTSTDSVSRN